MKQIEAIHSMHSDLIPLNIAERVRAILEEGTAENTKRAYRSDLEYFGSWIQVVTGAEITYPVPLPLVIRFITDHLGGMDESHDSALVGMGIKAKEGTHSLSTVCRRIASLSAAHEVLKVKNPCRMKEVTLLLSKARKAAVKKGKTPVKKRALTRDLIEILISTCDNSLIGVRDKAIILFAFASGGRRRSEIARARVEDLTQIEGAFIYHLPYSKTDQEGEGKDLPVLGRAALALDTWLKVSEITEGPLFRRVSKGGKIGQGITDKTIARIVKKRAQLAGLDSSLFGAHSLRSGFITEAGRQGLSLGDTMALSCHKTLRVALGYYQAGNIITNPAAMLMG